MREIKYKYNQIITEDEIDEYYLNKIGEKGFKLLHCVCKSRGDYFYRFIYIFVKEYYEDSEVKEQ